MVSKLGRPKNLKDISGMRFGRVVVLDYAGNIKGRAHWNCLCDCGNTAILKSKSLVNGDTRSCGCLGVESRKIPYGESAINKTILAYKASAAKRGYSWELSREQFLELTQDTCAYCGSPPTNYMGENSNCQNGGYTYNGIDRVNNDKGYSIENCVPCCGTCNKAKGVLHGRKFLSWIKQVYEYQYGVQNNGETT